MHPVDETHVSCLEANLRACCGLRSTVHHGGEDTEVGNLGCWTDCLHSEQEERGKC